jgi:isopentenyl diphosphate isomerase/L-lactate dehydrogenase-like FMN-dependent dehydrogenase
VLPPAHFGYVSPAVDEDATLHANREGWRKFQIRPRRVMDLAAGADISVDLLGTKYETPIVLAPALARGGSHRAALRLGSRHSAR